MSRHAKWIATLWLAAGTMSVGAAPVDELDDKPSTPREQAIVDRVDGMLKSFADSTDPAIRALYSMPRRESRPDGTVRDQEAVPVAVLIEQSRGSTDPVVLDLLLWRCSIGRSKCDRLDLATRWTQADAENQVAWLMLASVRKQLGDVDGAREAFLRAARASVWHDHYGDVIRRTAKALPADLSLRERAAALAMVFDMSGAVLPFGAVHTLGVYCEEPGAMRDACARIVETIVRDAEELMPLGVAAPYAIRAHVDPLTVGTYRQKTDALRGGAMLWYSMWPMSFETVAVGAADANELPGFVRRLEARVALGERRQMEQFLMEQNVSEAEAAKRYAAWRASLSAGSTHSTKASP